MKQFAVVRDENAKVTRYELAIPWSVLGGADAPLGPWLGLNVLVNDSDAPGDRGFIEWTPGIGRDKDPSKFPKVLVTGG